MRQLVECVPNFSEGRDAGKINAIVQAVLAVPEGVLLDREADADHNRSVLTFAGTPAAVAEAAFRAVEQAVALIDLTKHQGAHPRIGAADVVPFIPIEGVTLEDCVQLAERLGAEIWNKLRVPVYLYEAAARARRRTEGSWWRHGSPDRRPRPGSRGSVPRSKWHRAPAWGHCPPWTVCPTCPPPVSPPGRMIG